MFGQIQSLQKKRASRLEICQKIYTTGFLGQQICTLKPHKLQTFFANDKTAYNFNISDFSPIFVEIEIKLCNFKSIEMLQTSK